MTYNSLGFFVFFAIFLICYLLMSNGKLRQAVILVGSLAFYLLAAGPAVLMILIGTAILVYLCSRQITKIYVGYDKEKEGLSPKEQAALFAEYKKKSKKYLIAALVLIVGFLVFVKMARLLQVQGILVPLGISYYTFSSVGYLLDIYWKKASFEPNFLKLLLCMTYFPHIVQGPIGRYDKLLKQFDALPKPEYRRICFGLQRMLWGFFKKMVVADRLALYTTAVWNMPDYHVGLEMLLAIVLGAVELYADFSGCMDIVCGAAQTMGVTLDENFRRPFFAKNAAEFWRRWHITLGTWFKDYIYMPIAMNPRFMKCAVNVRKKHGNRAGQVVSAAIPLTVVWLLTGVWHGTGMNYVVWGLYWGVLIILETIFTKETKQFNEKLHIDPKKKWFQIFQMVRTFLVFCVGRMLTVTGTLTGFTVLIRQLFAGTGMRAFTQGSLFGFGLDRKNFIVALIGVALIWIVDILQEHIQIREWLAKRPLPVRWLIYYGACVILLIFARYGSAYDASSFIYGGF